MNQTTLVLTTPRTVLTPFVPDDVAELLPVFRDPDVRSSLLDGAVVSPQWIADEIERSEERFARFGTGMWSVRLAGRPAIVGFVGLREFFDPPELQLLYGLLPECWGQGLATEVTRRVRDYVFGELRRDRITATTDLTNRASMRVLHHLGMELVRTSDEGAVGTAHFAVDRDAVGAQAEGTGAGA